MYVRFRWVELQLQFICSLKTTRAITNRLGKLPRKLGGIYEDIYASNIDHYEEEDKITAEKIFRWLLCSQRPLRSSEFCTAISLNEDGEILLTETVLQLCCNFVVHDQELDVFRFAHLSVREYLEEKKDVYSTTLNHATAAKACLATLMPLSDSETNRLHEYACWYWALHCAESGIYLQEGELQKLFNKFMLQEQDTYFARWSQAADLLLFKTFRYERQPLEHRVSSTISLPPCSIFAACSWGFTETLHLLLETTPLDYTKRNKNGETLLYVSCCYGNLEIMQQLFDRGADVNAQGGHYGNALQAASVVGHDQVVERLLAKGADVNAQGGYYGNALRAASFNSHDQVVERLLAKGADANTLQAALAQDHDQIVKPLIITGSDINRQRGGHRRARRPLR
jgi:hypothetical protein